MRGWTLQVGTVLSLLLASGMQAAGPRGRGTLHAAPGDPARDAAQEAALAAALAAFRASDDAALVGALAAFGGDPVAMAAALLQQRVEGGVAAPPRDADALEAAARLATLAMESPRAVGLEALVAAWRGWDAAAFVRESAHVALRGQAGAQGLSAAEATRLEGAAHSPAAAEALFAHALRVRRAGADAAAVGALQAALRSAEALPWPLLALRVRRELAQALLLREGYREALVVAEAGIALAPRVEDRISVGILQRARAGALLGLDRPDEALEAIEQAYVGRTATWNHSVESQRAGILSRLGRRAEAVALGERLLAALEEGSSRREGGLYEVVNALTNLASFEAREGRVARAITLTERALETLAAAPPSDQVRRLGATAIHNLAAAQRSLGDPERALAGFERAERERRALGLTGAADRSAGQAAMALETLRRFDEALAAQRELARRARARGSPLAEAQIDVRIARLLRQLGQDRAAHEHAQQAVERARAARVGGETYDALETVLASVSPEPGPALARLDAHLATRGVALGPYEAVWAHATRASLLLALQRPEEAAAALRHSFDGLRVRGLGLGEHDMGGGVQRGRRLVLAFEIARRRLERFGEDPAQEEARSASVGDALYASEATRALRLQDGLANRNALLAARASPDAARAERDAPRSLDEALEAASRLGPTSTPLEATGARTRIEAAEQVWVQAAARLRRDLRFGAEAVTSSPITLAELRTALGDARCYVAYERAGTDLVALAVGGGGVRLTRLGPVAPIDAWASAWLDRLAAGADDRALAQQLYDALLRPLEGLLPAGGRLLIAPDASLARLPFAALLRTTPEGASERLLERASCVLVPSATTWRMLREEAQGAARGRGVLAVGRPSLGAEARWPDLPRSEAEARRVAELYPAAERTLLLGPDATRAAFLRAAAAPAGRWAALHFAGHALMDADRPNLSALVLADGERLGLDDLTEGGVAADLAVLSACETALARDVLGEGASGFPRRLFLAGCPRVVVTAWPIEDGAGSALLEDFHARIVSARAPTAEALAAAQRARARAGDPPSAWAPFLLWGLDE